jgi:hypothetical protein
MNGTRWTQGRLRALAAAFLVLGAPVAAWADEPGPPPPVEGPAPDKSDNSVFNPVPAAALRGFSVDRPTKSFLPYTVDAGHFQVESDLAVYGVGTQDGQTTRNWTVFDPTLKLGLTNSVDLELQVNTYQAVLARTGSTRSSASGWGDTYAKVKINLIGNDGGKVAVALLPYAKAPTARAPLGNGAVEGGMIVPVSIAVPHGFTIVLSPEFDWLRNAAGPGYHGSTNFLINLSHPVGKAWTVYAEAFTTHSFQHGDRPLYTFDTAASLAITPTLQWDIGGNFKVSGVAPDAQIYTGFARRF